MAMQKVAPRTPWNRSIIEPGIPPALRPVFRAYILGYASSTAPRLLTLLLTHLSRKRKNTDEEVDGSFLLSLLRILKGGLEFQRFPTFCAALVGGLTLLQVGHVIIIHLIDGPSNVTCSYHYENYLLYVRRSFRRLFN
jgi:hypothetical protein